MKLVTGGRGRIARATVARLRAAGERVRVISRSAADLDYPADVEVIRADLGHATDWAPVLDGVTGVLLYAEPSGVDRFIEAARTIGVGHITLLSAAAVEAPAVLDNDPIVGMHRAAEAAVRASGLPWTFLRPGGLATNTLGWAQSIRAHRMVRAPFPGAHAALIHEADVADVAALALTGPRPYNGGCYRLTGPESATQEQQVRQIAAAISAEIGFEEITPEEYRRTLAQWGDDGVVDALIGHLRQADGRPEPVSPAYQALTGRPGRPFSQWARDHADAFR